MGYRPLAEVLLWWTSTGAPDKDRVAKAMKRLVDKGLCSYTGKKAKGQPGWKLSDGTQFTQGKLINVSDVEENEDY
jgi:hypothetical protein